MVSSMLGIIGLGNGLSLVCCQTITRTITDLTFGNTLKRDFNWNTNIFIQGNTFENVISTMAVILLKLQHSNTYQAGKLKFFGTHPNWEVSYIAYTKFYSPRPVFHSLGQIFTRISEWASASFPACLWCGNCNMLGRLVQLQYHGSCCLGSLHHRVISSHNVDWAG